MCKSFRIGLVFALFGAIVCNMYLIYMLWSGSAPNDQSSNIGWQIENVNKYFFGGVRGLNISKLKEVLYLKPYKRKPFAKYLPSAVLKMEQNLSLKQGLSKVDLARMVSKVLICIQKLLY